MNELDIKITKPQLELMKHAIGLDNTKSKRKTYTAYRNYFCTYGGSDEWESLVKLGVAKSNVGNQEIYPNSVFYHVSEDGLRMMEEILGFKIVECIK